MKTERNRPFRTDKNDVLLVHDKWAGTVNVVKVVDIDGNLQTVPPTQKHASEFMRVDNNSDQFTNFFSNFRRKINDTEGLGFFRCNFSVVEQNAEAIRQGNKQGEMLRVPKPNFHEFPKNKYRIDESLAGEFRSHQLVEFLGRSLQALGLGESSGWGYRNQSPVHPARLVGTPEPFTFV